MAKKWYGSLDYLKGYLTSKCKECEFWKDGTTNEGYGCACPFPISHCEAFEKENIESEDRICHTKIACIDSIR